MAGEGKERMAVKELVEDRVQGEEIPFPFQWEGRVRSYKQQALKAWAVSWSGYIVVKLRGWQCMCMCLNLIGFSFLSHLRLVVSQIANKAGQEALKQLGGVFCYSIDWLV